LFVFKNLNSPQRVVKISVRMQRVTLIIIASLLLLSQIPHVFANSENISKEVENIDTEEDENIYRISSINVVSYFPSVGTIVRQPSPTPPTEPFPIDKIFRIIKQILDTLSSCGVGYSLLAWFIWNAIKGLRRGRPRDYRGIVHE